MRKRDSSFKHSLGVFDSGIGGLSVIYHLASMNLPIQYCYFADSAYMPYGSLSKEMILKRSHLICQWLIKKNVDSILIACNTATAIAIDFLRSDYPEIVFIGIEPGIKPAIRLSSTKDIAVLATSVTIKSARFDALLHELNPKNQYSITVREGHGLVERVEGLEIDSQETQQVVYEHLDCLINKNTDVLVLGCTHYSFLKPIIHRWLKSKNQQLQIIDTSEAVAGYTAKQLGERPLNSRIRRNCNSKDYGLLFATSGSCLTITSVLKQLNLNSNSTVELCEF